MRILVLIAARGGSKRLPRKNIRLLGGKPLIVWSIDAAKGTPDICDILVSTDNQEIAGTAQKAGGYVPWIRPARLSTDTAPSIEVAIHALDWYESVHGSVDGLMLLQPTSPFRSAETIKQAISMFKDYGYRPVISVSPAASHPAWCFRIEDDSVLPFIDNEREGIPNRSQDLTPAFVLNGAMYLAASAYLRKKHAFIGNDLCPLIIESPVEALDIDTEFDFMIAECIAARRLNV